MRPSEHHSRCPYKGEASYWTIEVPAGDGSVREIASRQTRDEMYLAQDLAFVRAVQGRSDPRSATGEDGVRALAVCDAARRASESRAEESVRYLE